MDREKALTEARVYLMSRLPFVYVVMHRMLKFEWAEGLGTASTDGRMIKFDPDFMLSLNYQHRAFVLAHECLHAVFHHTAQFKDLMGRNLFNKPFVPKLANISADYVINHILHSAGIPKPDMALYDEKFTGDMGWKEVYKELLPKVKFTSCSACSGAKGNDGNGAGDGAGDGDDTAGGGGGLRLPKPANGQKQFDIHELKEDPRSESQWKQAIAEAVQAQKSRGDLPGGLQAVVDEFLEPKISWREELRAELLSSQKGEGSTWNRPNRRAKILFDAYLPASCDYMTGTVVVGVDTSGSVSDAELSSFMSEVSGILADAPPEELWLLSVDAKVHEAEEIDDPVDLELFAREKLVGRGGTDMTQIFKWVDEQEISPDFVVVLTDGFTPFGVDPGYPVIWVMSSDNTAPFGKSIQIDITEEV